MDDVKERLRDIEGFAPPDLWNDICGRERNALQQQAALGRRRVAAALLAFAVAVAAIVFVSRALGPSRTGGPVGHGTEPCKPNVQSNWEQLFVPWLSSLLTTVGAPEGWPVSATDIIDTQSALEIRPEQYRGRLTVYVHGGVPDPEHDPAAHMSRLTENPAYVLFHSRSATTESFVAKGAGIWLSLYAYSDNEKPVRWNGGQRQVERWFEAMFAQMTNHPVPTCIA
jgi:hypothetical protein